MTKVLCKWLICKWGLCFTQGFLYPGHTPWLFLHCACVPVCVGMLNTNLGIGAIFAQHLVEGARQLSLRCLNRSQNLWGLLRKHLQGKQRRDRGRSWVSESSEMFSESGVEVETGQGRHWRSRQETLFINSYWRVTKIHGGENKTVLEQ